jgi:hypothetical protein
MRSWKTTSIIGVISTLASRDSLFSFMFALLVVDPK